MTGGRRVAIVGVGYSDAGRRTGLSELHHAAQAARAALVDAGLESADIDGLTTWGGNPIDFAHMLGFSPLRWHLDVGISPAFISPAIHAVHAVASGQADTVVAMRVILQQPSQANLWAGGTGMAFDAQFQHPFGDLMPAQWAGLLTNRYLHESDATEEDFANFAVTQRGYAAKNPEALMREPLTVEDYLAAPYISKPLRLLDCDYPCDSGAAVIFTTEQRARDLRQKPVFVEATALSATHDMTFELLPDMVRTSPVHCLRELWSNIDLTAADLDCAQLYDGFSVITLQWLEALGICEPGQAGPFVSGGGTSLTGALPTNTDGGACNVGRRHGANFCIEATRQLRGGQSGERQVADAEVAVWTNAVGPFSGAMLLTGS
ncbi:thiolase family protein [Candidatus Frankia alpina]|uniref:Thiolase family protein n=1 Tax=Candidatus Frankia alpina TaxID=2699483 RepID=A0A4S5BWU3_9ACTN|nr:thiolase family protein [Candidatus Frankia alpina]THJ37447.1 thiolase family protein [Candidatus Frankia alpina]